MLSHFSHVQLCATLWNAAHQAPLSMGFSRQEYWSRSPCASLISIYIIYHITKETMVPKQLSLKFDWVCMCVYIYHYGLKAFRVYVDSLNHSLYSPFDVILSQLWSVGTFFYVGCSLFLTWPIDLWKCPYFLAHRDLADSPCSLLHHAWNQTFPSMSPCCF